MHKHIVPHTDKPINMGLMGTFCGGVAFYKTTKMQGINSRDVNITRSLAQCDNVSRNS